MPEKNSEIFKTILSLYWSIACLGVRETSHVIVTEKYSKIFNSFHQKLTFGIVWKLKKRKFGQLETIIRINCIYIRINFSGCGKWIRHMG